jgi:ferredoxin
METTCPSNTVFQVFITVLMLISISLTVYWMITIKKETDETKQQLQGYVNSAKCTVCNICKKVPFLSGICTDMKCEQCVAPST